jgi:hypothetical protein
MFVKSNLIRIFLPHTKKENILYHNKKFVLAGAGAASKESAPELVPHLSFFLVGDGAASA